MNNLFEEISKYGFHDTTMFSIDGKGLEIKLNFDEGIYLLDTNGKETILSKPMQIVLRIDSYFDSFEEAIEIKEYGKKVKYIDYLTFKKYLQKLVEVSHWIDGTIEKLYNKFVHNNEKRTKNPCKML